MRSDWLKQSALSENRARVDNSKLVFNFLLQNLTNLTQTSPVIKTNAMETSVVCKVNTARGYRLLLATVM